MTFTTRLRPRYDAPRKHQLPSTIHQGALRRRLTLKAAGSIAKNPQLFRGRAEPKTVPLGEPSPHLGANGRVAWFAFKSELPWLGESDRAIMEIACHVRGKLINGADMTAAELTLLRQTLSTLGATPADRSRIMTAEEQTQDPLADFFNA
jgi:hypothetical protein